MNSTPYKKKKRWKFGRKALSFLLTLAISGAICSQTVNADLIKDGFRDKNGTETLEQLCEEITIWREVIKGLPEERPEHGKQYTFWWGNLDDEPRRELIVRIYQSLDYSYQESLLVYDIKEDGETRTPVLLFETTPYVQIRSGFAGNAEGTGVVFNAVVGLYKGDCEEGTVQLNQDKSDLEYTVTRTYSMANQEKASEGTVDISGYYDAQDPSRTNWGSLSLDEIVSHDFVLGRDNNSFKHNINPDDERSGFANISSYEVSAEQKDALLKGESKGTKADIKDYLNGEFGGVCLGLTSMIELVKSGDILLSDYGEDAAVFYEVGKPSENKDLFHQICFLHTTQLLLDDEDYDSFVDFGEPDSSEQLQNLVQAIHPDQWQILGFISKDSGHALLVKSLTYYESLGLYDLECYDINSLADYPEGHFYHTFVKDDFSSFVLTDANGQRITQDNCDQLSLISSDSLLYEKEVKSKEAEKSKETAILSFVPSEGSIICTDAQGNETTYQDGQITGNGGSLKVIPSIVSELNDGGSHIYRRVEISASESYTIQCDAQKVDVRVNTGEGYYSVRGQGIDTIVFSQENGIQITGRDFTFTAGLLMNGNQEHLLTQTTGSGAETVTIRDIEGALNVSSEAPVTIGQLLAVYDTETIQHPVNRKTTDLTLSQDGTLQMESSENFIWILPIIGVAAAATLLVILLIILKKRRNAKQHT